MILVSITPRHRDVAPMFTLFPGYLDIIYIQKC